MDEAVGTMGQRIERPDASAIRHGLDSTGTKVIDAKGTRK